MSSDIFPFWKSMFEDPRRVGSIVPSGRLLGRAIARETVAEPPGHVIEIGAGTGSITRALFELRSQFESFNVIEQSPRLADCLRRRFPGVDVHAMCASNLDQIHAGPVDRVTIVSSIPFRSLQPADRVKIIGALWRQQAQCRSFRFIQYSYGRVVPFRIHGDHFHWSRRQTVWANIPPATVWVLAPQEAASPCLADPAGAPGAWTERPAAMLRDASPPMR